MEWVIIAAIALITPFYARYVLAGRRGGIRWALFLAAALPIAWVPFLLPVDTTYGEPGRIWKHVAAVWTLVSVMRLADFGWDRFPDETLRTRFPHFLIAFLSGSDARWIEPSARSEARKRGLMIFGRGLAKLPFVAGLLVLSSVYPAMHDMWFLQTFWILWLTYFLLTAGADFMVVGIWYVLGIPVEEAFDAPPLASSPRDFWSRRWNLIFRTLAHRHIFLPLDGRRRPLLAVSAVFIFSALVHEYIIVVCLGSTQGHMAAFFLLQGAATIAYGFLSKRRGGRPLMPRPVAVGLHLAFFTVTSWLFFQPMLQIIPLDTIQLW